jgi:hypothetical protein
MLVKVANKDAESVVSAKTPTDCCANTFRVAPIQSQAKLKAAQ